MILFAALDQTTALAIVLAGLWSFFLGVAFLAEVFDRVSSPGETPIRARRRDSLRAAWCIVLVAAFYHGPGVFVRLTMGTFPLGRTHVPEIREGMNPDDVAAVLGAPHRRDAHPTGETWSYLVDSFGEEVFLVDFDERDRVEGTRCHQPGQDRPWQ